MTALPVRCARQMAELRLQSDGEKMSNWRSRVGNSWSWISPRGWFIGGSPILVQFFGGKPKLFWGYSTDESEFSVEIEITKTSHLETFILSRIGWPTPPDWRHVDPCGRLSHVECHGWHLRGRSTNSLPPPMELWTLWWPRRGRKCEGWR